MSVIGFLGRLLSFGSAREPSVARLRRAKTRNLRAPEDDARRFHGGSSDYCVRYFTGFFIIFHSPVSLLYTQLQNAIQLSLSMLGLSARK